MHDLDDFHIGVLNHSALQLAGLQGEAYAIALHDRIQQLNGMLELARRLGDDLLVRALETHRGALISVSKRPT